MKLKILPLLLLLLALNGCAKEQQPIPTGANITEISQIEWQIYSNQEYGFEMKIPKTWSAVTQVDGFWLNPDVPGPRDAYYAPTQLTIRENSDNLSIPDWYIKTWPNDEENLKNFTAINIDTSDAAMALRNTDTYSYFVKKKDKIYEFSLSDRGEDLEKINEMMQTIVYSLKFNGQ